MVSSILSPTLLIVKQIPIFRKPKVKLVLMAPVSFDTAEHISLKPLLDTGFLPRLWKTRGYKGNTMKQNA